MSAARRARGPALALGVLLLLLLPLAPLPPAGVHGGSSIPLGAAPLPSRTAVRPASPGPGDGAIPNGEWVNVTGSAAPSARFGASMAYDSALGQVILFGGCGLATCPLNDTWAFSGGAWTQLHPSVSPPGRWAAMMAYDPQLSAVILFGGCGNSSCTLNDTWEFTGPTWAPLSAGPAPQGRSGGSLVYDANGSRLLLFGGCYRTAGVYGYNCGGNALWELNASFAWLNITPSGSTPRPRAYEAAATDPSVGGILVTGGSAFGLYYQQQYWWTDTWGFAGGTWTNFTAASPPDPCCEASAAWDNATDSVLLFGGQAPGTGGAGLAETWSFSNGSWTNVSPSISPSARWAASMAYDPADGEMLLFGGENATSPGLGDSWAYRLAAFPAVGALPASGAVDAGQVVTFTVPPAAQQSGASYLWSGLPDCADLDVPVLHCATAASGEFPVEVNVSASNGTSGTSVPLLFTVLPAPGLASLSTFPPVIDTGQVATFQASASGGSGQYAYLWSALPPGCPASSGPVLQCSPNGSGTFRPVLEVVDSNGGTGTATLPPLLVNPLLNVSIALSPTVPLVGHAFTISATIRGGTSPTSIAWSALPGGCTLASTISVACNESQRVTLRIAVEARDAVGSNVTEQLSIPVNEPNGTGSNTPVGTPTGILGLLWQYSLFIVFGIAALALLIFYLVRRERRPGAAATEPEALAPASPAPLELPPPEAPPP